MLPMIVLWCMSHVPYPKYDKSRGPSQASVRFPKQKSVPDVGSRGYVDESPIRTLTRKSIFTRQVKWAGGPSSSTFGVSGTLKETVQYYTVPRSLF